MTAAPLRVGIVGGGFIGRTVGESFFQHPEASVVSVADPSDEARADVGEQFAVPVDDRYREMDEMLAAAPLDAVLIGTPHTLHYDQVLAALDADLHVLCDKPLATDLERARTLVDEVERSDRTVMVGYQRHVDPAFVAGRERWQAQTPDSFTAEITQGWIEQNAGTWRTNADLSGGGFLYDTGNHLLDVLLWMTGLVPESVRAEMTFIDDERRIDSRARLLLNYENGTTATVVGTGDAATHQEHIHVLDDDGAMYFEAYQWGPTEVTEIDEEGGRYRPSLDRWEAPSKAGAFVEAVLEGTEPPATVRDALAVTAVTEAAYESARSGGERVPVDIDR